MIPELYTTVCLTRVGQRGANTFTTNDGAIWIDEVRGGEWQIAPTSERERPFTTVDSLQEAVDFVLGAREMMRPT